MKMVLNQAQLVILVCSLLVLDSVLANSPAVAAKPEYSRNQGSKMNRTLSTPLECARACRKGEPPKICYYQFTLEMYTVLGGACQLCTPNNTNQLNATCQCVTADGIEKTLLTANRMLPGPSIQACKGDRIVVDVKNHMEGMEVSIHWHGVLQTKSPHYDGASFITQCPIAQGSTFRYDFLVDNSGTHFWHAHTGLQKMDGIHGSLIVREPPSEDPNSKLYDEDSPTHVVLMADWMHDQAMERFPGHLINNTGQHPDSVLINGRGRYTNPVTNVSTTTPYEVLTVKQGRRYRFRLINAFCTTCPAQFTCEGHNLTLIAVDGVPVEPTTVTTINSVSGERYDFVIDANKSISSYWIQVRALGGCAANRIQQLAILRYEEDPGLPTTVQPTYTQNLPVGKILGPLDGICNITRANATCISQLKSAVPVDKELIHEKPCAKFYFALGFLVFQPNDVFKPNTYQTFFNPGGASLTAIVNNVSFIPPTSPPLSQYKDISANQWCSPNETRPDCGRVCYCTQRVDIPLHCSVEFIFTDAAGVGTLSHPIHTHGYAFNVIGMGNSPNPNVTKMSVEHAMELDANNQLCRNKDQPPFKDTIAVPAGGYAIVKFRADNPGWWLVHCHFLYHLITGMSMLLHVGEPKDLSPIPPNFPRCGDHLPPIEYDEDFQDSQCR